MTIGKAIKDGPTRGYSIRSERTVVWWRMPPLVPALRRQRQAELCEFEAGLVYRVSSRPARSHRVKPCLINKKMNGNSSMQGVDRERKVLE